MEQRGIEPNAASNSEDTTEDECGLQRHWSLDRWFRNTAYCDVRHIGSSRSFVTYSESCFDESDCCSFFRYYGDTITYIFGKD
jgi:hypothetical protein